MVALLGVAVSVVMAAPLGVTGPYSGLDPSWVVGINAVRGAGLRFGPDVVFTYGPWGFVDHPLTLSRLQFALAGLVAMLVVAALTWVLTVALRRVLPIVGATVAATVITLVSAAVSEMSLLAVTAGVTAAVLHVLAGGAGESRRLRFDPVPAGLAAASALLVQVKLSVGVTLLVVALLAACVQRRPARVLVDLAAAVAAFTVAFAVLWVAIGQDLGTIGSWAHASADIVTGYGEAMAFERRDSVLGYVVAVALVAGVVVWAVRACRETGRSRVAPVGALVMTLAAIGFAFKAGFTRHDEHELVFFVVLAGLAVAWAPYAKRRATTILVLVTVVAMVLPGLGWLDVKQVRDRWRVAAQVVLTSGGAPGYTESNRLLGQQGYQLPQAYLDEIGRHPVSIDPYDSSVAVDYKLRWHPMPVFQSYQAYTPYLDDLNAAAARGAPADQYVLRFGTAPVDNRNSVWETPAYQLTLACDYARVMADGPWLLLEHAQPRCDDPVDAGSASVQAGEPVSLPKPGPDEMLVARFEADAPNVLTRLFHAALKDFSPFKVTVDGTTFRLPEALVGQDVMYAYPDQGDAGLFTAFEYHSATYPTSGTLHFSTIKLRS